MFSESITESLVLDGFNINVWYYVNFYPCKPQPIEFGGSEYYVSFKNGLMVSISKEDVKLLKINNESVEEYLHKKSLLTAKRIVRSYIKDEEEKDIKDKQSNK